ncbi:MAG: AraC family transcriptional regulator [Victivallaceae bacterium]|nr:AraC family transcriptional regulator [Victivallaceae bacterium]
MHKAYTFIPPAEYYIKQSPELLFVQYDENLQDKTRVMHAHDFWQLEMVVAGQLEIKSKKGKLSAVTNDCLLIPPGIPHRIIYGNWKQSTWSVKFELELTQRVDQIILLEKSAASMQVRDRISQHFAAFNTNSESYITLQHLLATLIELEFQHNACESGSAFVNQVKILIDDCEGRPITIKELADKLRLSRNTVSNKFHKETGVTLKAFIDLRRAEIAGKMLLYSSQKIIDIARIMGFSDMYSFSRFFRHHQGCSPRQYRIHERATP